MKQYENEYPETAAVTETLSGFIYKAYMQKSLEWPAR